MTNGFYKPYFEAVKNVLEGTKVDNLDDILRTCSKASKNYNSKDYRQKPNVPEYISQYPLNSFKIDSSLLLLSTVAKAENEILTGKDIGKAYANLMHFNDGTAKSFSDQGDCRKYFRSILEERVKYSTMSECIPKTC